MITKYKLRVVSKKGRNRLDERYNTWLLNILLDYEEKLYGGDYGIRDQLLALVMRWCD